MVSTSAPSHCTVSTVHDLTDLLSRSTVQAPQWLVSQPMCGPVCRSLSRNVWISNSRGSTSTSTGLPLSLNDTACLVIIFVSVVASAAGTRLRHAQCPLGHFPGHCRLVRDIAALIGR